MDTFNQLIWCQRFSWSVQIKFMVWNSWLCGIGGKCAASKELFNIRPASKRDYDARISVYSGTSARRTRVKWPRIHAYTVCIHMYIYPVGNSTGENSTRAENFLIITHAELTREYSWRMYAIFLFSPLLFFFLLFLFFSHFLSEPELDEKRWEIYIRQQRSNDECNSFFAASSLSLSFPLPPNLSSRDRLFVSHLAAAKCALHFNCVNFALISFSA